MLLQCLGKYMVQKYIYVIFCVNKQTTLEMLKHCVFSKQKYKSNTEKEKLPTLCSSLILIADLNTSNCGPFHGQFVLLGSVPLCLTRSYIPLFKTSSFDPEFKTYHPQVLVRFSASKIPFTFPFLSQIAAPGHFNNNLSSWCSCNNKCLWERIIRQDHGER